jgi:hypothetical protein
VPAIERAIEMQWGGPIPKELVLVTPGSIAEDARLNRVYAEQ